ncbi:hypothetical protein BS50DRAFT_383036 [Corynespora cassiicola Philippines]|uniref:Uncharacterized protein n=1 Tax=Corynespora cassiicola Philippines TaxID=1448308 RepID=A0A2T2NNV8_CORCC|nr:hypothetical protein BS50DRAFT_383036 [Corynespora cassiicola Philippines]
MQVSRLEMASRHACMHACVQVAGWVVGGWVSAKVPRGGEVDGEGGAGLSCGLYDVEIHVEESSGRSCVAGRKKKWHILQAEQKKKGQGTLSLFPSRVGKGACKVGTLPWCGSVRVGECGSRGNDRGTAGGELQDSSCAVRV